MVNAWPVVEVAVKLWLLLLPPPPPPPLLLLVKGGIQASRAWNMLAPDTPVYTERPRFRYLEFRDLRGGIGKRERKKERKKTRFRSIDQFDSPLINYSFVPFRYFPSVRGQWWSWCIYLVVTARCWIGYSSIPLRGRSRGLPTPIKHDSLTGRSR